MERVHERVGEAVAGYDDTTAGEAGVSMLDIVTWIGEGKWAIAKVTGAAAVVSVAVALALPNVYTARTSLLPASQPQAGGAAAALSALGALGGLGGGLSPKTPDELYVALLRSDSVQKPLDEAFKLRERLEVDTYEELRKELLKVVRVNADRKSGVVSVEVDDEEPAFAARLANAYGAELSNVLSRLAVTEAQQRRLFFEHQLKQTKEKLVLAEDALRRNQEQSGVIVLDKQAEALIQSAAYVRAQIAEREVQLRVLRSTATAQNPAVQRLEAEVQALRSELRRMEAAGTGRQGSAVDLPVGNLPAAAIEYIRARRELKLQETLLEGIVRQYELARLDEAKEGPPIQVVDAAVPPDRKSKPRRALIVAGVTVGALLAAVAAAIVRGQWRRMGGGGPESAAIRARLRDAWSVRRRPG